MTKFQPKDRLNWHFVVVDPSADFHKCSLLVHRQEARQVVEMSAEAQAEVDREEEAAEHNQEEHKTAAGEFERLVGHSFVCSGGMKSDLAGARQEDTCSDYILLALVDLIVEDQSGTRRIGPS